MAGLLGLEEHTVTGTNTTGTSVSRQGAIQSDGLTLHFVEWGPAGAPAIVMLHGLRSYAQTWEPVARSLIPRWRVIALDQRGRGRSDWDPDHNYFTKYYVRDLEVLVDTLNLERFVLLGHSMGGANALVYASHHSERLAALVVEDMGPGASLASAGSDRIKQELMATPSSFTDWTAAAAFWSRIRPDISEAGLRSRLDHSMKQQDDRIVWRYDAEGIAHARLTATPEQIVDLWPHVEALRIPTLLIRGRDSDFLTKETADEMCRRSPMISLVEISAAKHYVHDENIDDFNSNLSSFLERLVEK